MIAVSGFVAFLIVLVLVVVIAAVVVTWMRKRRAGGVLISSGRTAGRSRGAVKDVIIVGGPSPRVVGFEVAGGSVGDGLVPVGRHSAVSGSSLIVPDGFEQRIRTDLTGLAGELASLEGDRG